MTLGPAAQVNRREAAPVSTHAACPNERGRMFEFTLNHVMHLDDPMDAFHLDVLEVGNVAAR